MAIFRVRVLDLITIHQVIQSSNACAAKSSAVGREDREIAREITEMTLLSEEKKGTPEEELEKNMGTMGPRRRWGGG